MTRLALDNGCNINDANNEIECSSPLFIMINHESINDPDSLHMRDVIQYLTSIGYDLEEPNKYGQTPLHYAALKCSPTTTIYLRLFIERGARLDIKDDLGMGLLHTILLRYLYLMNLGNEPYPYDRYGALELVHGYLHPSDLFWLPDEIEPDERDMYSEMNYLLRQNSARYCRFQESVGNHFPRMLSTGIGE